VRVHHLRDLFDGGNQLPAFAAVEAGKLLLEILMQQPGQVRSHFPALFRQSGMHDSPVRNGPVPFHQLFFLQLVQDRHDGCRAQVGIVGKGFGRHLPQIPNALQNNDLRNGETGQPRDLPRAQIDCPHDLPDRLDHLR